MQRACLILSLVWSLLLPGNSRAQDLGEFEIPENLKGDLGKDKCPEGTEADAKGWCVKKEKRPVAPPVVVPVPEPASTPAPEKTPEPIPSPDKPAATRPTVGPGPEPAKATTPPEKPESPLPADKEPAPPAPVPPPPAEAEKTTGPRDPAGDSQPAPGDDPAPGEKEDAEESPEEHAFVKGELADLIGSNKLVTKNNRVGVRLGYRQLDLAHYATINPEADFRIWKFQFGLGVPMALEIFDGAWDEAKGEPVGFDDAGDFRTEDWNERSEYVRFIRYLRFGRKEDNVFFDLNQYASTTIGHGPLMRRYSVNIDPDSTRLSGELDMYNDYAGFEFVINSITDADLFGTIAFVKPLSFFMDHPVARSLSLGVTYMADRHAPVSLRSEPANPFVLPGTGHPEAASHAWLHALGVDMEIKVLKTRHIDLKPFVDYSWFMPSAPGIDNPPDPEGGGGFTLGILGRFNFGEDLVHAIRAILEFRSFSSNYLPGYFDTFYEVQKYISSTRYSQAARADACAATDACLPPTKFTEFFINRKNGDRHLGFYLEFTYSLVEILSFTLALEGSDADSGNNFLAHLEVPVLDWFQFFASYHHRAMNSLGDLFASGGGDRIAFAAARVKIVPFIFLNFSYHYTFELREDFETFVPNEPPYESHPYRGEKRYRLYEPAHGWLADIEFGWEF